MEYAIFFSAYAKTRVKLKTGRNRKYPKYVTKIELFLNSKYIYWVGNNMQYKCKKKAPFTKLMNDLLNNGANEMTCGRSVCYTSSLSGSQAHPEDCNLLGSSGLTDFPFSTVFLFFLLYELSAALLPAKPSLLYFKWKHGHLLLAGCCSVVKSCLTLRNPGDCSTPGFPVLHYLPVFVQTYVHWVSDATQPSHPLLPPFSGLRLHGFFQK